MSDTVSQNIASVQIVQQRLGWSFLDHYSSLLSYTEIFSSFSTNATQNTSEDVLLLVNLSLSVKQLILPELSSLQVRMKVLG